MNLSTYCHTSNSVVESSGLLELIHGDLMDPMRVKSKGVDDWSRYINVYLIKVKSEAFERFKEYTAFIEAHLSCRIKILRTKKLKKFYSSHGILQKTSAPCSPKQNGLVERDNRSIGKSARSSLLYQHVDESFGGEAVVTAAYTLNQLPNDARGDQTPYELVWGEKDHIRVLFSPGFVYVDKSKGAKFDTKAHRCIFLDYAEGSKAYRVWDCETNRIVVTRTIALYERPPSDYVPASYTRESQLQWTVLMIVMILLQRHPDQRMMKWIWMRQLLRMVIRQILPNLWK
ncbi:hypothetical protein PsorP6_007392 [Peronosclerospora sorghi]|uniref:Uncharacterized protein n=1 Tax=Peronosclerospora sorghi TaxID=230839 RepID=A0ACC0W8W7_9STRA|nr:hypothetical protein PsorP6_007392 [Peronosclerospora sorghi]